MARRERAYAGNQAGDFFVDDSCIDCGTCYHSCPEVFMHAEGHSQVQRQPGASLKYRAHAALISCPTNSIGSRDKAANKEAGQRFPAPVQDWLPVWSNGRLREDPDLTALSWCGCTSEKGFGAWSYFIQRPAGNLLMDSPRAHGPLLANIEAAGGIRHFVLSHKDDVADHALIAERFGCERMAHADEGLAYVERSYSGSEALALADDLLLIPTPGHTAGSQCLLWNEVLFTGDHLWWNPEAERLSASQHYCWYDWAVQLDSLRLLLHFDFRAVFPGHGRPFVAGSVAQMRTELERAIAVLAAQSA